jgi:hypothetical protein
MARCAAAVTASVWCGVAQATPPVDKPGPPLDVPPAALAASLRCPADLRSGPRPVLLVPGTGEDPDWYAWTYEPALAKLGIPYCTVTLPAHATGDIQVAGEYVVSAIRTMYARAGRRVDVLGHSQGGMVPRWALRFWPDTRAMVDDLVGLAPSNHGTQSARLACASECNAASWQQKDGSNFIGALNDPVETFAGISYTAVYSHDDEIVTPNGDANGSSSLHTGAGRISDVAVQDICPADSSEHLAMGSYDPVAYALAIDALTHDGPADAARIDRSVCMQPFMPGVDPATFATDDASATAKVVAQFGSGTPLPAEPPLACYATGDGTCPASAANGGRAAARRHRLVASVSPRRFRHGRHVILRVLVRAYRDGRLRAVAGAHVRFAGMRATTDRRGRALLRKQVRRTGLVRVLVTRRGYRHAVRHVRAL